MLNSTTVPEIVACAIKKIPESTKKEFEDSGIVIRSFAFMSSKPDLLDGYKATFTQPSNGDLFLDSVSTPSKSGRPNAFKFATKDLSDRESIKSASGTNASVQLSPSKKFLPEDPWPRKPYVSSLARMLNCFLGHCSLNDFKGTLKPTQVDVEGPVVLDVSDMLTAIYKLDMENGSCNLHKTYDAIRPDVEKAYHLSISQQEQWKASFDV